MIKTICEGYYELNASLLLSFIKDNLPKKEYIETIQELEEMHWVDFDKDEVILDEVIKKHARRYTYQGAGIYLKEVNKWLKAKEVLEYRNRYLSIEYYSDGSYAAYSNVKEC